MSDPGHGSLDYERVRSELAERGYLGGRVERFVLQGGSGRRFPPRLVRSALKAALLGAPVLALLVAATVARENRPLIAGRDLPLLWLYFTPLCALALFLLDASVGWISGRLTDRFGVRGGEVTRAALLAGLPTLAYLLLLGREARASQGFAIETGFFALGVLVVVFVSWLAGLVSVAGILGRTGKVAGRRTRSLRTLFVVVPLAMLALTVLRLTGGGARSVQGWPEFEIVPAARLLFIGVDGLDGAWIEALEPSGAVERLLDLMAAGTVLPLRHGSRGEPPEVWMSMLTGMPGEVHGVRSAGAERFPGVATPLRAESESLPLVAALRLLFPSKTVPTSGAVRQVRTVGEIVGHKRRALSVGWWGSWPASGGDAASAPWVVSDRVLAKLLSGAAFDRDAWPEALYARLQADFPAARKSFRVEFDAAFAGHPDPVRELAWESFLIDAFHADVVRGLWDAAAIDSAFVYLPGLEILRHRVATAGTGITVLQQAAVFESYTSWFDGRLADLIAMAGEDATIMVVTDPGRRAAPGAEGFAVVRGAGLPRGCVERPAGPRAVATLALALSGFPASAEMPPLDELVCLRSVASGTARVPTYGRRRIGAEDVTSPYDEEMVERLRSLGYLN